jgi:hypothetical protein
MHIHWGVLEKDGGSGAPSVDTRGIRAILLLRFPGPLSERGLNGHTL